MKIILEHLSRDKYKEACEIFDGNMQIQSTYTILKPVKKMVDEYKVNNVEYAKGTTASPELLSKKLDRDEDGQVVLKDN